jgi:DNA polymerase-1
MGEKLIFDTESDGFLAEAQKLHMIQIGTADGDDVTVYTDALPGYKPLAEGLARLRAADKCIGHNMIKHDAPLIEKLYPGTLRRDQVVDTLVMVRLKDPEERQQSLGAIGTRLGVAKGDFEGPLEVTTEEMATYAAQDVTVNRAIYHYAKEVETWGSSLQVEMETAWAIAAQERNGFRLDVAGAQDLEATIRGEVADMTAGLRDVFPPIWVSTEKVPFVPKGDNRKMGYVAGCPLTKVVLQHFNPASRSQVAKRLMKAGWKPRAFGANGEPTVDEAVLAALPFPEAKRLVQFFTLQKMLGQLSDGKNGWLKLVKPDGRVYGAVNPNGACTGRMSHFAPNLAQVSGDPRMRKLWIPRDGWKLVGCDAEGLEARMLAHYLARYDNGAFGEMLLNGNKELGTDVHSSNAKAVNAAGFKVNRNGAKTVLYALMYGAGDAKLGRTVIDNLREQGLSVPKMPPKVVGQMVRLALAKSMVGIDKLTDAIKSKVASVGYLVGLDGRHLAIRSEHAALNTLLQGGGAIVMKKALNLFMDSPMVHENWPDMGLCANVHDEVQIEATPELAGTSEDSPIGSQFAWCITAAGEHFNLRCPLAGAYAVGDSWAATH